MSSNELVVSIITPSFNQAQFLEETIQSILHQDYRHIEYIVIDGGSTDGSIDIIRKYEQRLAYWVSETDEGQAAAINKGWGRSKGDIIMWLNSDDTLLASAVTRAVDYLELHLDVGIVFGDTLFTNANGTPLRRSKLQNGFDYARFVVGGENPIPQPSAFIRRAVIDGVGFLDPDYHLAMDWDFWLRAGIRFRIAYLPQLLSTYRLHSRSKTETQAAGTALELERIYRRYFSRHDLPVTLRALSRQAMSNVCFTCGGYHLKSGNGTAAARLALKALCIYPRVLCDPNMFHKFLYCLFGEHWVYRSSRSIYYRVRAARRRFEKQNLINGVGSSFESHGSSESEVKNLSAGIEDTTQSDHWRSR